jgi:hypothetical protein
MLSRGHPVALVCRHLLTNLDRRMAAPCRIRAGDSSAVLSAALAIGRLGARPKELLVEQAALSQRGERAP